MLMILSLSKSFSTLSQSLRYNNDWGDLELVTISANPLLFWYIFDEINSNEVINYDNVFSSYKSNTLYGLRLKINSEFWYNSTIIHDSYFCKDSYFLLPMFCSTDIVTNEMSMIWVKETIRRQGYATQIMKLLGVEKVSARFVDIESKKFFDTCHFIGDEYNDKYATNDNSNDSHDSNGNNNDNNNDNSNDNSKFILTSISAKFMSSIYGELKTSNFIDYRTNVLNAFYDGCLYGLISNCDDIEDNVYCENRDKLLPIFCAVYEKGICGLIWTASRARRRGFATELIQKLKIDTVDSPMSNDNALGLWSKLQLSVKGEAEDGYYQKIQILKDLKSKSL